MRKTAIVVAISLIVTTAFAQKDSLQTGPFPKKAKSRLIAGISMSADKDIIENVSQSASHTELLTAIDCAGLSETFKSKGPITIFAPTNDAFAKMPDGMLDSLQKPEHRLELSSLVTYHAIAGRVTARDIAKNIREHKGTAVLTTLSGSKLYASVDNNRNIIITDESGRQSIISKFDIAQRNGMLHVVTGVFIPKPRLI